MTQEKDHRSARTRKREQADRYAFQLYGNLKMWATFSKTPAFPTSKSSSAPMVPEVSQ